MLPVVIADMIGIVIMAVAVLVLGILLFFSSLLAGLLTLLVGGLLVGKKCACTYTHTHTHTHARAQNLYLHLKQE
jgi:hypothetical protein